MGSTGQNGGITARAEAPLFHRNLIAAAVLSLFVGPAFAAPGDLHPCVEGTGGDTSTVCGDPAAGNVASGANALAVGSGNRATGLDAVFMGVNNSAIGDDASGSIVVGTDNVAGRNNAADGGSVIFGRDNVSSAWSGAGSHSNANEVVVGIGNRLNADGAGGYPGGGSTAVGLYNIVDTRNTSFSSVAPNIGLGVYNRAISGGGGGNNLESAIGNYNDARGAQSSAVGSTNSVYGTGSSAFGANNVVGTYSKTDQGNGLTADGYAKDADGYRSTKDAVSAINAQAVGSGNIVTGARATAVGVGNTASGTSSNAIGDANTASGKASSAFGYANTASGTDSFAAGSGSTASGINSVAVGKGSKAQADDSIALGTGSVANVANTISVGSATNQRRVVNVAAGIGDTDAVNVSQLKGLTTALGGGAAVDSKTGAVTGPSYVIGGTTYTDVGAALAAAAASGGGGGNLLVDASNNTWSSNATAGLKNTVALGAGAVANEGNNNSTAIGRGAQATGTGTGSVALGQGALAMGSGVATKDVQNETTDSAGVTSAGNPLLAAGGAVATDTSTTFTATSIGKDATVLGAGSVGIGNAAVVTGTRSVAIGDNSAASGFRSTALGDHSFAQGDQSIAIGADSTDTGVVGAHAAGTNSIAIGSDTSVTADRAIVLGLNAKSTEADSVALGANSVADRANVVAVGKSGADKNQRQIIYVAKGTQDTDAVNVSQLKGVTGLIGGGVTVDPTTGAISNQITVGGNTYNSLTEAIEASGGGGLCAGSGATLACSADGSAVVSGTNGIALGQNAKADKGSSAIAIGTGAVASSTTTSGDSLAIGSAAKATGQDSMALGGQTTASGTNSIVIGNNFAEASGNGAIAIGTGAGTKASADNALALGSNAAAINKNSVALGAGSTTDRDNSVSVGSAGNKRQVTNVAAGAQATDAVNVSQLTGVTDALGGGAGVNPDGSIKAPTYNVAGGTQTDVGSALTALDGSVAALGDSAVQYDDASKGTITLGGTGGTVIGNVADGVAASDAVNKGQLDALSDDALLWDNAANAFSAAHGASTTNKITNVAAGDVNAGSVDAVNGSQLYGVSNSVAAGLGGGSVVNPDGSVSAPTYNVAGGTQSNVGDALTALDGSVAALGDSAVKYDDASKSRITLGGAGGTVIGNVADGVAASDVVNKGQLDAVAGDVASLGEDALLWDGTANAFSAAHGGTVPNKITNVAAGDVSATSVDAINGSQLHGVSTSVATGLGGGSIVNPDGSVSAPTYNVAGGTQSNVGDALTALDGNIAALGDSAVQYDDASKSQVTFGGVGAVDPTLLTNVKDGAVAVGSQDAVTGNQLYGVSNSIVTNVLGGGTVNLDGSITGPAYNIAGNTVNTITDAFGAVDTALSDLEANGCGDGSGTNSLRCGAGSDASGNNSTALGVDATASNTNAVALGQDSNAEGTGSVAMGRQAHALGVDAVALGNGAETLGSHSIAFGGGSQAIANNSVALGDGSIADVANTVSVGKSGVGNQRRIVNLDKGIADTDAVNVSQLKGLTSALGGGAGVNADGSIQAPTYNVAGGTQTDVGSALSALDGDLASLGDSAVQYDDASKGTITLGGIGGTVIGNVADGVAATDAVNKGQLDALGDDALLWDGTANAFSAAHGGTAPNKITNVAAGDVSTASVDAVNGSQLLATNQAIVDGLGGGASLNPDGTINGPSYSIDGNSYNNAGDAFGAVDNKLTDLDAAIGSLGDDALLWDGGLGAFSASHGGVTVNKITNVAAGTVSASSTDAVNGSQLYNTASSVATGLGGGSTVNPDGTLSAPSYNVAGGTQSNVGDALTALDDKVGSLGDSAVQYDGADKSTITLGGADGTTITNVAAGELSADSTDAVNGSQLYATNQQVAANTQAIDDLDDRVTANEGAIGDLQDQVSGIADAAVQYDDAATKDTVTFGGADGTTLTNVAAGALTATSTDAVNGSQLYATNQQVQAISDNMNGQAPVLGAGATATGSQAVALGAGATAGNANSVALGAGSVTDRDNSVSVGSAGHERQITNVAAGTADTDAVNVAQLNKVSAGGVRYDVNTDGSINYNSVSFGDPSGTGGPVSLHNIAAGTAPTDAVNLQQLVDVRDNFARRVGHLEDDTNAGIAAAVAMEAAPYIPGHITYAVGTGYHVNQGAIGVTFRGTAENGRWSLSTGVATSSAGTTVRLGVSGVLW